MAACLVTQISTEMTAKEYPRKLLRAATYDATQPYTRCRKRLLSEHNECRNSIIQLCNDEVYRNKKLKLGNYT